MKMNKRMAATALAATSGFVGLAGALAPGASAASSNTYVHLPGTYWTTKAACQPYADGFKRSVANAGGGTINYTHDGNCILESNGWTYTSAYSAPKPIFSSDQAFGSQGVLNALKANQAVVTTYDHAYDFDTLAKCKSAYNGVIATVRKHDGTDAALDQNNACAGSGGVYSYSVTYTAKPGHALYPYETFFRTDYVKGVLNQGSVGASASSESMPYSPIAVTTDTPSYTVL